MLTDGLTNAACCIKLSCQLATRGPAKNKTKNKTKKKKTPAFVPGILDSFSVKWHFSHTLISGNTTTQVALVQVRGIHHFDPPAKTATCPQICVQTKPSCGGTLVPLLISTPPHSPLSNVFPPFCPYFVAFEAGM